MIYGNARCSAQISSVSGYRFLCRDFPREVSLEVDAEVETKKRARTLNRLGGS